MTKEFQQLIDLMIKINDEFPDLVEALRQPLPKLSGQADAIREMMSFAESCGILIGQYLRTLEQHMDQERATMLAELREDDGYKKCNADEKAVLMAAKMSALTAKHKYVANMESLIKRRITMGQSYLKSFGSESFNN